MMCSREVSYDDGDLRDLTSYRPELAGSPDKFFRILDKMKIGEIKGGLLVWVSSNLLEAGMHDLVVPLVNALGTRTFKSSRLKEEAIQTAFLEGARRGKQEIVELYCEHPAVTSEKYAMGLYLSWNNGEPNQVFPFLLKQADQDDLEAAKKRIEYWLFSTFCQAIDDVFKLVPPAGARRSRFVEKTEAIEETSIEALPPKTLPPSVTAPKLDSYNGDQKQLYHLLEDEALTFDANKIKQLIFYCSLPASVQEIRAVLRDTGKAPLDLHRKLVDEASNMHPQVDELLHNAYRKRRIEAKAGDEFDGAFDCGYFWDFYEALSMFKGIGKPLLSYFNRQEVSCDVVYFYKLMDFEDTVKCYEIPQVDGKELTPKIMSGLFGDALLGYMDRGDLVDREDEMAVKWAAQTVGELKGGRPLVPAGHMLHAALRLRKSYPTPLLDRFLRAVITIRLSDVLDWTFGKSKPKDLYSYLKRHNVTEEHFFSSGIILQHAVIASFKHRSGTDKADVVYINSGSGIGMHPLKLLSAEQYTETTPSINVEHITRYVPFAIYNDRPDALFTEKGGFTGSIGELYFNRLPDNAFTPYKDWQYIDDQKAGTCYAIVFWYLPYWLEQEDQLEIERLKLGLQLELLRAALNDFEGMVESIDKALEDYINRVEGSTKEARFMEQLDKVFRLRRVFISFGFNEALQTIRRLHLKGLDMTAIMRDYKNLWDEYKEKDIWKLIESSVTDTYVSAHNLILKGVEPLLGRKLAELSGEALETLEALEHAQQSNSPSEFTRAALAALMGKTGYRAVIQNRIVEGAKSLELEDHHKALIFEVAARERSPIFVKRLYREGIFAIVKDVQDTGALINYEDLPFLTDDELRVAAVQYQGKHERSHALIELLGPFEERDPFAFTKVAVQAILEGKGAFAEDAIVCGTTRFEQSETDKQLKPHHKALILWSAVNMVNANLIQQLCLSGPSFPLFYAFEVGSGQGEFYKLRDVIDAESDDKLLRIAAWVDEQKTIASRIFNAVSGEQPRQALVGKLRGELASLADSVYARQMSRYVLEGMPQDIIGNIRRQDTEDAFLGQLSLQIEQGKALEFVKTSVVAIKMGLGTMPTIQDKIIDGMKRLPLQSHHHQVVLFAIFESDACEFLKRLCLDDLNLPLIYIYDKEPGYSRPLHDLRLVHSDEALKKLAMSMNTSFKDIMRHFFGACGDKNLKDMHLLKCLKSFRNFLQSYVPPSYWGLWTLEVSCLRCLRTSLILCVLGMNGFTSWASDA